MKLHYHPISTTCRTIMLFAAENAIPLEMKVVDLFTGEHMQPTYAGLNPNRPVREKGGTERLTLPGIRRALQRLLLPLAKPDCTYCHDQRSPLLTE